MTVERTHTSVRGGRGRRDCWPASRRRQVVSGYRRRVVGVGAEGGVAVGLQLVGQLGPAGGDDAALDEDVHGVGMELGEQAAVVGDRQDAEPGAPSADGWVSASMRLEHARRASMSRPESSSSRIAMRGRSMASCSVSLRFFSPPDRSTLSERWSNAVGSPICAASASRRASTSATDRLRAASASVITASRATPGHLRRVLHHEMQPGGGTLPHGHGQDIVDRRASPSRRRPRSPACP